MAKLPLKYDDALKRMMVDVGQSQLVAISKQNDLKQSDLYKSVEAVNVVDGYELLMNYYWQFVDSGRKAGAKLPPFDAIAAWVKKYNLWDGKISLNRLVNAIRFAIKKNGIRQRPIQVPIRETLEEQVKAYFELHFTDILLTIIVL